jgi:hypothetical protein
MPSVTKYPPYELIFGRYSQRVDERVYAPAPRPPSAPLPPHPFKDSVKLKLEWTILESRVGGQENLKVRRYLRSGWLRGCFPLHHGGGADTLLFALNRFPLRAHSLPLYQIKEYFGEKVGLYFAFMEHLCRCLAPPALIGVPLQVAVFVLDDYSAPFLPFFSYFIAVWAVVMLELWKRREKALALEWGMLGFETSEVDRPGKQSLSPFPALH